MERLSGEIAAVGTAMFFAMGSTLFTLAGRQAGASVVNRSRLLIATLLALSIHWITRGTLLPHALSWEAWGWLALSGVIGLALGDDLLFRAYVAIGPARRCSSSHSRPPSRRSSAGSFSAKR